MPFEKSLCLHSPWRSPNSVYAPETRCAVLLPEGIGRANRKTKLPHMDMGKTQAKCSLWWIRVVRWKNYSLGLLLLLKTFFNEKKIKCREFVRFLGVFLKCVLKFAHPVHRGCSAPASLFLNSCPVYGMPSLCLRSPQLSQQTRDFLGTVT